MMNFKSIATTFCILAAISAGHVQPAGTVAQSARPLQYVFLPITSSAPAVIDPCDALPAEAKALLNAMRAHPQQNRSVITCDPALMRAAQGHALDMSTRNFASHVNPDGVGPNFRARTQGYALPTYYGADKTSNNIESLAAGYDSPAEVWTGLLSSPAHRDHMLGATDFFARQTRIGIGYAVNPNSRFQTYWVVVTAPATQ